VSCTGGVISNQRELLGWGAEMRVFYGWWIVAACMLAALFGNALGLFGALHEVLNLPMAKARGF
jgi:hypothetical protein